MRAYFVVLVAAICAAAVTAEEAIVFENVNAIDTVEGLRAAVSVQMGRMDLR